MIRSFAMGMGLLLAAALAGGENNPLGNVLPDVASGGVQELPGSPVPGRGTRPDSQLGTRPADVAKAEGNFTSTYNGATCFEVGERGCNGIFFADGGLPRCASGLHGPFRAS
jgi:hypothetical protein